MTLSLKGTLQEYYFMILFQLRVIPPYHTLQSRESELLSHLMALDMKLELAGINAEERQKILFSYETKIALMDILKISDNHYRNLIQMLRNKKFIDGRKLSDKLQPLRIPQQLIINFKIKEATYGNQERVQEGNRQRIDGIERADTPAHHHMG